MKIPRERYILLEKEQEVIDENMILIINIIKMILQISKKINRKKGKKNNKYNRQCDKSTIKI